MGIYWPIHSPTKREVLELNANVSRVLEGHRVKKCAFWKNFLPRLLSLTEAPRPCESTECCDGSTGGGLLPGPLPQQGIPCISPLIHSPYMWSLHSFSKSSRPYLLHLLQ